jgi:hypothetical protein
LTFSTENFVTQQYAVWYCPEQALEEPDQAHLLTHCKSKPSSSSKANHEVLMMNTG